MPCEFFHTEHEQPCDNPAHVEALTRRAAGAPAWGPIDRTPTRDYLDGRGIHCGDSLELQAITYHADDYGEYTLRATTGVRVRYELSADRRVVLYASLGGHPFTAGLQSWMRFRWP